MQTQTSEDRLLRGLIFVLRNCQNMNTFNLLPFAILSKDEELSLNDFA